MGRAIDPSRAICGIATCFDTPTRDGQKAWAAQHFDLVCELELPVPLRVDHGPIIASWGFVDSLGTVERFASVEYPVPGLLILAEIGDADGFGDSILRDIARSLSFEFFAPVWSFSVGALWDGQDQVILREISLTRTPGFSDAKVLGVGPAAVEMFAMLTEKKPVSK
jgi:hypothetical protein